MTSRRNHGGYTGGDVSQWDGQFRLLLANELKDDRPWLGTLHLVAIYSRALSDYEVTLNHYRRYN